jgi:hypothetical protein
MQIAVRSYLTAGIAVVGATALIASPISVAPPEVHLPAIPAASASVDLAAVVNPITEWVQVIQTTFNNVAALGQQVQNDPAPILQQFITNQLANIAIAVPALEGAVGGFVGQVTALPAALLTAANQLAAGDFNDAVQTVFQAGLGLVLGPVISLLALPAIATTAAQNFANVVAAIPNILLPIGLSAISPIAGAVAVFGSTGQQVIDALGAGDVATAISAIVNAPAALTDAVLNGVPAQGTVGLLTPFSGPFSSGLIASLLNARDTIAQALGAPVPPPAPLANDVAKPPSTAKAVTLSTATPTPVTSDAPAITPKTTAAKKFVSAAKPEAVSAGTETTSGSGSNDNDATAGSSSKGNSSASTGSTTVSQHRGQSGAGAGSNAKTGRNSAKTAGASSGAASNAG